MSYSDVSCPLADLKTLVILSWTQLQALVEMYAKDESKRAEMLKCPHPSQHLLKVEETVNTALSPGTYNYIVWGVV